MRCYRLKKKGFTLIELIITLAITVIVLGVIYTFARTSNMTLTKTKINSTLQEESEIIQRYLINYGTQAEDLVEINNKVIDNSEIFNYENILSSEGKLELIEMKLKVEEYLYEFSYEDKELLIRKFDKNNNEEKGIEFPKSLSKNIERIEIRPIDFRMNENKNFKYTKGVEISITLKMKKGNVEESLPLSIIIKFRNKQLE